MPSITSPLVDSSSELEEDARTPTATSKNMRSPALRLYTNTTARNWIAKARASRTPEWRSACLQCALGARRGYTDAKWSTWAGA